MATVVLGISVECSSSTSGGMDEDCTITLSFDFPDRDKPVIIKVPVKKGQTAADITVSIARAITKAVKDGEMTQEEANGIDTSTHTAYGRRRKQDTAPGGGPLGGGRRGGATGTGLSPPLTDPLCKVVCTGVDSVDVGDDDHGKIKYFAVTGLKVQEDDPPPPPKKPGSTATSGDKDKKPPGGVKPVDPAHPPDITVVDCKTYFEDLRKGPGTPEDWWCRHRGWRRIVANILPPPGNPLIGHLVIGTADIDAFVLAPPTSYTSLPGVLLVPFLVIPGSPADQLLEFQTRLAAAGVVTQDRTDGVLVPTRVLRGGASIEPGAPVRTVGIISPYNPFGYGRTPWTIVIGAPDEVARHAELVSSTSSDRAPVRTQHGTKPPHFEPQLREPRAPAVPQRRMWEVLESESELH